MDTHDCIATYAVVKGIQFELHHNIFTITSVDNIDVLQRHSMVSCTQSKRSWHGTSIQAVQPMSKETIASEQNCITLLQHCLQIKFVNKLHAIQETLVNGVVHHQLSPNPKQVEKRKRTLREKSSIHTQTQVNVAERSEISSSLFASMYESTAYQRPAISEFTIRSFQLLPEEVNSLNNLQKTIFQYMLTKEAKSVELNMPGIASYLQSALYSSDTHEQTEVVYRYVDILSLPADSKETVLRVLHKLYNSFIVGLGFRWLIVVGDAKTSDILLSLRQQYGSQLNWLLPFPGDWHILYNYQKLLLKVYGDAWPQLAKVAGHRAETLTSLAHASHFKRTDHFILQSFEVMHRYFIRMYIASNGVGSLTATINELAYSLANLSSENDVDDMLKKYKTSFDTIFSDIPPHFSSFMDKLCSDQKLVSVHYQTLSCLHCSFYCHQKW